MQYFHLATNNIYLCYRSLVCFSAATLHTAGHKDPAEKNFGDFQSGTFTCQMPFLAPIQLSQCTEQLSDLQISEIHSQFVVKFRCVGRSSDLIYQAMHLLN